MHPYIEGHGVIHYGLACCPSATVMKWTDKNRQDGQAKHSFKKQGGMHKLLNIKIEPAGSAVWTLVCSVVSRPCAFNRTWQKCVPLTTAPITSFLESFPSFLDPVLIFSGRICCS